MKMANFVGAVVTCLVACRAGWAIELEIPREFEPLGANVDLGDISSNGLGGRQILVRPLEAEDIGRQWKFFPPHDQLPDSFPDPTPATPAQGSIYLSSDMPLVLVLPQLRHFPFAAAVSVSHQASGQEIAVEATLHDLGVMTHTIYGPHEYLYPLGQLEPGEYRLRFNLERSSEFTEQTSFATGYVDFTVHAAAVPEPGAWVLVAGAAGMLVVRRRTRDERDRIRET